MGEHYYSSEQASDIRKKALQIELSSDRFTLMTASGLFSKDGLDFGTRLLIESIHPKGKVLDLGCGYGVVGIALLRKFDDIDMIFSDVNSRAVAITKENLKSLNLSAEVHQSDIFERISESFESILTNPPYAAGRVICFAMIEGAHAHLNRGGMLYVVARHAKGGAMIEKRMKGIFGNVKTIAKKGGFRVYAGERK